MHPFWNFREEWEKGLCLEGNAGEDAARLLVVSHLATLRNVSTMKNEVYHIRE